MSRPSEGLDTAIEAYRLNQDVQRIARRVVDASDERHLRTTGFLGLAHSECGAELEKMQGRLDEITVMVLWSAFERWLIDHVTRVSTELPAVSPETFAVRLRDKIGAEVEFWRFDSILDLLKGWIDSGDVGRAKQIKAYRDWIAHRNPLKRAPAITDPATVRNVLGGIIDVVGGATS
jgi:hypothetical protein